METENPDPVFESSGNIKRKGTFFVCLLRKDIITITDTAKAFGVRLPMIKKAEEVYNEAFQNGFGGIDYTGVLAYIRKINEMEQKNKNRD